MTYLQIYYPMQRPQTSRWTKQPRYLMPLIPEPRLPFGQWFATSVPTFRCSVLSLSALPKSALSQKRNLWSFYIQRVLTKNLTRIVWGEVQMSSTFFISLICKDIAVMHFWSKSPEIDVWVEKRKETEKDIKKRTFSIFQFPTMHSISPQVLHKLLLWNTLGNMQTSQEHFTTIVYAKFGGQTERIMRK